MAADDTLRVDPAVLHPVARAVDGGAEDLIDRQVGALLGGWHGAAGSAYAAGWEQWRRGAAEVLAGLSILASGLAEAGTGYRGNEADSARALREVAGRD
ncbi:MAG: WXG100 family type VII secretion target [Mycobacterium sp.]